MFRFALLPTGDIDINNLHVAIINYLLAQKNNEKFLIRIDDIETQETMEGKDTEGMMLLEKFALKHDAVFHQSEHLKLYQTLALRLLQDNKAFLSTSIQGEETHKSYTELKASGEKFMLCVKEPSENICYHDLFQGQIEQTQDEIGSFDILNEDGTPSKDFAIAADDMMNNINFIVQKETALNHTAKQVYLKTLLGYKESARYAHLPQIHDSEGVSAKALFQEGYLPDAIINYLILLGYNNAPEEIFTLPDAVKWFDLSNLSNSSITFDIETLKRINKEHLRRLDDKTLSKLFGFADADIGKVAKLYLEECSTINLLETKIRLIFAPKNFEGTLANEMKSVADLISHAPTFDTFDELKAYLKTKSSITDKELQQVLQYLLTGSENSPELSKVYPLIKSYILEVIS